MTLNLMKDIYLNSLINRYRFGATHLCFRLLVLATNSTVLRTL